MITIPPIYADIRLREYSPDMEDIFVRVWLNPSLDLVRERLAIQQETAAILSPSLDAESDKVGDRLEKLEALRPRRHAWLAKILSHGDDSEKRYLPDLDTINHNFDVSPDFVQWLTERVSDALDHHRTREKKTSPTR